MAAITPTEIWYRPATEKKAGSLWMIIPCAGYDREAGCLSGVRAGQIVAIHNGSGEAVTAGCEEEIWEEGRDHAFLKRTRHVRISLKWYLDREAEGRPPLGLELCEAARWGEPWAAEAQARREARRQAEVA